MDSHSLVLLTEGLSAIVILIVLIAWAKLHPFVSIVLVSLALALITGMPGGTVVHAFETGVGNTLGHIAIVIGLGTMLGKMMAASGGADRIAETLVGVFGPKHITWAMVSIGLLTGLPVFFDAGFVLLMPIAFTVARRAGVRPLVTALPLLSGLSIVHALIPPHPAAMAAVMLFHADVGRSVAYALLVGVPAAILAGPVYVRFIAPRITPAAHNPVAEEFLSNHAAVGNAPGFGITVATILLPIVLMLAGGWADKLSAAGSRANGTMHLIGNADVALLIGVLVSFVTLGLMSGITREQMLKLSGESLGPIAGAVLLIGAGGGFGRILQDSGVSNAVMLLAVRAHLSLILTTWLLAALVRIATGSSTVAMTTAASMVAPIALQTAGARPELLAIAAGAGSIVFSHVNDGGFWLVKEYLNMSVTETFQTWTVTETILSFVTLGLTLIVAAAT